MEGIYKRDLEGIKKEANIKATPKKENNLGGVDINFILTHSLASLIAINDSNKKK